MARVLVVGLGSFGGGIGVTRFCAARGDQVRVTDLKPAEALADSVAALADVSGVEYVLGEHRPEDLDWAELLVASPAVPPRAAYLEQARARGLPITSEIRLFLERCPAPVVGVTGSNGKSTTTTMIDAILRRAGRRVHLGGNLGRSLLGDLPDIDADDLVVLELSSFQLEDLAALDGWAPSVGVLTNVTPNHLDRHGTFEAYGQAKRQLFLHQGADGVAVLNHDDPVSRQLAQGLRGRQVWFGLDASVGEHAPGRDAPDITLDPTTGHAIERATGATLFDPADLPLPGRHNLANALAAAAAARACGAPPDAIAGALAAIEALPHRLQPVATHDGRRFVNDSVATTPESAIAALEALADREGQRALTLLVGGADKGSPLDALAAAIRRHATLAIVFGVFGERLAPLLDPATTARASGFDDAFARAAAATPSAGVVLLSPAAASYDEFRNFEARGDRFRDLARAL